MKNLNDPNLLFKAIKFRIRTQLLGLASQIILGATSLTENEREEAFNTIRQNNDKELIKAIYTLALFYNPFLSEYKIV